MRKFTNQVYPVFLSPKSMLNKSDQMTTADWLKAHAKLSSLQLALCMTDTLHAKQCRVQLYQKSLYCMVNRIDRLE